MVEALTELNGLHAIVPTPHPKFSKFVASLEYYIPAQVFQNEDTGDFFSAPAPATNTALGVLVIAVGCDSAWWGVKIEGESFRTLLDRHSGHCDDHDSPEAVRAQCRSLVDKLRTGFQRQQLLVCLTPPCPPDSDPRAWPFINLLVDPESEVIPFFLSQLEPKKALARSTYLIFNATSLAPSPSSHQAGSNDSSANGGGLLGLNAGTSMSSREAALERKLEETQQALREERHKYRALLAAPSAANGRAGSRTVVGLPRLPTRIPPRRGSQQQPSSPSSGRGNASGSGSQLDMARTSSGAGAQEPSSEDVPLATQTQQASQRALSLVNPTRVRRADPKENDGFVGDDE